MKQPGKLQRFIVTFTAQESAQIARALKTLGFTFSELIDAATALATLELNPITDDDKLASAHADVGGMYVPFFRLSLFDTKLNLVLRYDSVALNDRLPPTIDRRRHIVSCMAITPLTIRYGPLAKLNGKARLVAAMQQAKEQYHEWLANPCLPHLMSELSRIAPVKEASPPGPSPFGATMTNVGRVESYVSAIWPRNVQPGEAPVFRVEQMHIGHRSTWVRP